MGDEVTASPLRDRKRWRLVYIEADKGALGSTFPSVCRCPSAGFDRVPVHEKVARVRCMVRSPQRSPSPILAGAEVLEVSQDVLRPASEVMRHVDADETTATWSFTPAASTAGTSATL